MKPKPGYDYYEAVNAFCEHPECRWSYSTTWSDFESLDDEYEKHDCPQVEEAK